MPWCTDNLGHVQTPPNSNFRAPIISSYSFGDICRPFQPSHLKNREFHFFTKLHIKRSSYAVVHRHTWPCRKSSELKNLVHQEFNGIHLGTFIGHFQPSHLKNHESCFFTKLPTKQSTCVVVRRQPWPCANLSELKNFVHQEFHGIHLGTFVGLSNLHIPKSTNFIFSQNSPPSNLAMSWFTDNLGHVQIPPYSKLSCSKNLMVFIWGHL